MPGNRSLDEFAGGGGGQQAPETDGNPADEVETGQSSDGVEDRSAAEPDGTIAPKAETYAWSADGGPCARCGETVEERWRDGDDLVCPGCKAW